MFFAHRTKQRLRLAAVVCATYVLVAAAVAALFPHEELGFFASFGWWLCAIPIGFVVYVAVELFGTWALERPFWRRMPSWAHVLLLVTLICAIAVCASFVVQYVGHDGSL